MDEFIVQCFSKREETIFKKSLKLRLNCPYSCIPISIILGDQVKRAFPRTLIGKRQFILFSCFMYKTLLLLSARALKSHFFLQPAYCIYGRICLCKSCSFINTDIQIAFLSTNDCSDCCSIFDCPQ
jgi:hypothetical protein